MKSLSPVLLAMVIWSNLHAQQTVIDFEQYNPRSTLKVSSHPTSRAKFPFVDVHGHQWTMNTQDLSVLVASMDSLNMKVMVNLSGRTGKFLEQSVTKVKTHYPNRFIVFANIEFSGIGSESWVQETIRKLRHDFQFGAGGLKIFEALGTRVWDVHGQRVPVDDLRLEPIWKLCEEFNVPVLIHTGAPKAFWDSLDNNNERLLELLKYPSRIRTNDNPAPWHVLMNEQHKVFARYPKVTFIAAHLDWLGGDLDALGKLLDEYPNVYTEFGAVIAELGRQPRNARIFFEKYQDRILFGKDSWVTSEYPTYFRVLETEDEYFPYHKKYHAFWSLYGLGLSDEILKKVYYKNALKIFPYLDDGSFPE
jgi:predicted TIM-barrel fold metal-dependent hydrolase